MHVFISMLPKWSATKKMYSDNLDIQYSLFDNQLVNVKQELTWAFNHFLANIIVYRVTWYVSALLCR